jgi:DNA-binding transcriptional MerR regulator
MIVQITHGKQRSYTRTSAAMQLGLSIGQFDYLVRHGKLDPPKRGAAARKYYDSDDVERMRKLVGAEN